MTIKATEEQLNKIFNLTNYQFKIPSYQRFSHHWISNIDKYRQLF